MSWLGRRLLWLHRRILQVWQLLWSQHRAPGRVFFALLLGFVVGCTPLFGVQIFICMALARLLRLNLPIMYAAANISIPPMVPVLGLTSVSIVAVSAAVLLIDLLIAALFAASLHFIMGPAGMHSFGHAAYFGLGAYGAALLVRSLGLPMELALVVAPLVAAAGAFVYGWFAVRLSGVYLAMLTLAFAQIT